MSTEKRLVGKRYQILDKLGEGGMGTVFKGMDTQTNTPVAIKLLKSQIISDNPDMIERFKREGEALRQLNHPNIVKMLAMVEEGDEYFLVMEYVSGGDLRQLLSETKPLPLKQTLSISLELADALTRAHHLNIIHRDLKPANVLIASDGTLRLTDFGVAHMGKMERVTGTGVAVGTLDYLSPEILSGEAVDNRADIWSFGVMLFEILTGQLPFSGEGAIQTLAAIANKPVPDLEALCPDVSIALVDLIYRMLEKNRDTRIRSIRLVGAELEAIMQGETNTSIKLSSDKIPKAWAFNVLESDKIDRIKHNLPTQVTAFVGREEELERLTELLSEPDSPLVTILASGGMGKSRLALELAEQILRNTNIDTPTAAQHQFADGIYFIDLAPLRDHTAISSAIAEAVGFHFRSSDEQIQQLVEFLQDKKMLLLLDNFEHLLAGVDVVNEIMTSASKVRMLVTSRERLKLQGETLLRLEGMTFPKWKTAEEAMQYSATRLFLQSAQRAQPGFTLRADDLQYVEAIFRQVEGMPLGIVMAAAWVEALSLPEIVEEITRSLDFLETDSHNVPERHRSIRAVFSPTWERLSESEKKVFMKLSIFRGGFTREAAQSIAKAGLRDLAVLMGKALISRDPITGRYSIHELLRQYARTHLQESSENINDLRDAHAKYYADFYQQLEHDLTSGKQLEAATKLSIDLDNVRAAWEWASQTVNSGIICQLYAPLFQASMIANLDIECLKMAEKTLGHLLPAQPDENQQTALAIVYQLQSAFALRLGQIEKAKTSAEASLELVNKYDIVRKFDTGRFMFGPRFTLGIVSVIQGEFSKAEQVGTEQLHDAEAHGDELRRASAFYILMIASLAQGRYQEAYDHAKQAHDNALKLGHLWFVAYVLDEWGNTARALGNFDEARELYQRSLDIHKSFDDAQGMGAVLNHLADVTLSTGELAEAEQYFQQSVRLNRKMSNIGGIAESLAGLGNTMLRMGNYERAEQHFIEALSYIDTELVNFTLSILIGLGDLWIQTNKEDKGSKLLAFVLNYHASKEEIKERVERTITRLGKDIKNPKWKQATQLTLEAIIEEILEEISKSDTSRSFYTRSD